jgi:type IX secretion system substrate protein
MIFQRIALALSGIFLYTLSFAQPANDNFVSAITIVHSSNNCSANAAYTTINATADLNAGSCWENGPNYNAWFTFVATSTDVTLDLKVGGAEGTMQHPNMALWQSDGITEIKCVRRINATTDVQISTSSLTIGNTYYISVDNYVGSGYQGTFTLCIDDLVTNDDIAGATTIIHSSNNCSADAAYSTVFATSEPLENAGSCWENGPNYTRWFTFVATSANVTLDLKVGGVEGSMRHPNMALWQSDGITEIKCVRRIDATTDVQISTASLTIGNTYYVSVDNYVGIGYRGTFTLCIDNTVTYDDYNGAITIVHSANNCSADAAYTTINATPDLNAGSCWENGPNYNRWFTFVATSANLTLDLKVGGTEGSMRHPNMALWQSDGITEIKCVRRIDATTDVQISTASLTIGNTYYVSVDNYVGIGYRGTFTLCIDNTVTYDDYNGAITIVHSANNCSADAAYTTINATPDLNAGSCWENGPNYNRWFTFVATSANLTLDLKVGGTEGSMRHPNMALWQSDGITEIKCVRRIDATTDVQISTASLTIGNTYYVSVDNYVGLDYRGAFTLCIDNTVTYDDYNGAILLTDINNWCSADAAYSTINATADLNAGSCWENGPNYNRWFKFVATTKFITLDLKVGGVEGSMRHPNMALWQSDGITEVQCVRRVDATTDVQISTASLTIGNTYYISVDNYVGLGYRGTFTLCADENPSYDYYEGAIELTNLNNWCSSNAAFTTINGTADKSKGSCWENGPNYNRWFKFTAISANVTLQMNVAGVEGSLRHPNMALWASDGTTELACVRRVDATTDVSISYGSLVVGQTYYVSCDNYVGLGYRGTFTLCINNIDGTYYSRGNGIWTNANTWSIVSHSGPAAADYPQVGDVAFIESDAITITGNETIAELNMNAATSTTDLTINGGTLTIQGQLNMTNPGNNFNSTLLVRNTSTLSVNDNLTINRNGGTATLDLTINNSSVTVNKNFEVYSTAGTNDNTIGLVNGASLTLTEDALLSNTGGPKTFLTNDASTITFTQDLTLTATADNQIELALTSAGVINFKKDVIRGTPAYGILNSATGTTVNFNSTNYLQNFPHSTGSGTGDTFTYQNVVINNSRITSPQLTLDGAVTINETLTLTNGEVLSTTANLLTLVAGSSVSGATIASFVDGPIKKIGNTPFEFPVGDNNFWQPISLANIAGGDAATEFTAQYFEQTPTDNLNLKSPDPNGDLNNISGLEYWDLINTGTLVTSADLTLYWKDQTRSDIDDATDLQIAHYTGTEWETLAPKTVIFTDPGSIEVTGVTSFSPFTFGSLSNLVNALPIELINFEATKNVSSIILSWATASELNNDYFSLEKSEDADNWQEIAKVDGQGNSLARVDYSFIDENPFKGNQYYRLKQIDFNGDFSYSKTILVNHPGSNKISFNLYPNPVEQNILYIKSPTRAEIEQVYLMDLNGRTIQIEHQALTLGDYQISLKNLSGVYIVVISTKNGQYRQKILKL